MNNIQTFKPTKTSKIQGVKTITVSKNILSVSLTDSLLYNQNENIGVFDDNLSLELGENALKEALDKNIKLNETELITDYYKKL